MLRKLWILNWERIVSSINHVEKTGYHMHNLHLSFIGLPRKLKWQRICLPTQKLQETRVQSLGQNDPLEEKMAIHSSILAGTILWTEEPGGLHSMGSQRIGHNRAWKHLTLLTKISLKWIKDLNKRHKTKNLREGLGGNLT